MKNAVISAYHISLLKGMVIRHLKGYAELLERKSKEQTSAKNHSRTNVCKASLMRNKSERVYKMKEYIEQAIDVALVDLDVQIKAANSRKDDDMVRYLQGKKQGLAIALDIISDYEEGDEDE